MSLPGMTPPLDARSCCCPAPRDDDPVGDVRGCLQCPACCHLPVVRRCWAATTARVAAACTADVADGGDMIIMLRPPNAARLVMYGVHRRGWVDGGAPPAQIVPLPDLDGEHPETLDDALWIAASWLATLPETIEWDHLA